MMKRRISSAFVLWLPVVVLAGCAEMHGQSWRAEKVDAETTATIEKPGYVKYHASDEALRLGREHFYRGAFGTAERYFRSAAEKSPEDLSAWMGLAAAYDRIGRFDLADKAYRVAIRLGGETAELLNNQGYSLMLRGDLRKARAKFERALDLAPGNETVENNLKLLDGSQQFIRRDHDAAGLAEEHASRRNGRNLP